MRVWGWIVRGGRGGKDTTHPRRGDTHPAEKCVGRVHTETSALSNATSAPSQRHTLPRPSWVVAGMAGGELRERLTDISDKAKMQKSLCPCGTYTIFCGGAPAPLQSQSACPTRRHRHTPGHAYGTDPPPPSPRYHGSALHRSPMPTLNSRKLPRRYHHSALCRSPSISAVSCAGAPARLASARSGRGGGRSPCLK